MLQPGLPDWVGNLAQSGNPAYTLFCAANWRQPVPCSLTRDHGSRQALSFTHSLTLSLTHSNSLTTGKGLKARLHGLRSLTSKIRTMIVFLAYSPL